MRNDFGTLVGVGIFVLIFMGILSNNCSRQGQNTRQQTSSFEYQEEGLDRVIKQLRDESDFTVILYDMNTEGSDYYHQYQVLIEETDSTFDQRETDWLPVSENFFKKHIDNLGMEIAHKDNGVLEKETAPAGYSQYVGNEQYGQWVQRNGNSFWEFYGKFAFMSSMFNLISRPVYGNHWNDYNRNYRGSGNTYYGPDQYYGTRGYTASSAGRNTTWGRQPQSFKQQVRSRVSRSSSTTSRSRSSYSSSSRTSRSGSRFSGSSSYRSRGGGYGGK